jgi:hypothetical protein
MSPPPFQEFLCSRSALLTQALTPEQETLLLQASVFCQIQADRKFESAPTSNWLSHRFSALESLHWCLINRCQETLGLNEEEPVCLPSPIRAIAEQHLEPAAATAVGTLLEVLAAHPKVPPVLSWTATPEQATTALLTLSLTIATSSRKAVVIAVTVLPTAVPEGIEQPLSSDEPAFTLRIALREYKISEEFWLLREKLQSTVGKYVADRVVNLSDPV